MGMLLRPESGRPITAVLLEASNTLGRRSELPWRRRAQCDADLGPVQHHLGAITDARGAWFAGLVRDVLVGDQERLEAALTDDASGWAPNVRFGSRREAVELVREQEPLLVHRLDVAVVSLEDQRGVAEWFLHASWMQPLMLADDLLVEAAGLPLWLPGVSVVVLHERRVAEIRSYYDDAAVLEQLFLAAADRRPGQIRGG